MRTKINLIVRKQLARDFVLMFKNEIENLTNQGDPKKYIFVNNTARIFLQYEDTAYWRVIWARVVDYHKKYNFQ